MTKFQLLIFLSFLFLTISGCKRQRIQKQDQTSLSGISEEGIFSDTVSSELYIPTDFSYLTTRSKISIQSSRQNIDNATVAFRIRKDSLIWLSAQAMGFEVMRGRFTADSVEILDRSSKVYISTDYRSIAGKLGFAVNFPLIQSLFLGDLPVYPGIPYQIITKDEHIVVKQEERFLSIFNMIDSSLKAPTRAEVIDRMSGNSAEAFYSGNRMSANGRISGESDLTLFLKPAPGSTAENQLHIRINHTSINVSDSAPAFPFQIPINYKKAF